MSDAGNSVEGTLNPICPNCREPLQDLLRQRQLTAVTVNQAESPVVMTVVFCGSCGWTLSVVPFRSGTANSPGDRPGMQEVVASADGASLEGQFQLRCRELVTETRALGFNPNVWVPMINDLGALGAAKKLLADHHVLVATPWLVARGREELTLEHEIAQLRWTDLFTDEDRVEAARRATLRRVTTGGRYSEATSRRDITLSLS